MLGDLKYILSKFLSFHKLNLVSQIASANVGYRMYLLFYFTQI